MWARDRCVSWIAFSSTCRVIDRGGSCALARLVGDSMAPCSRSRSVLAKRRATSAARWGPASRHAVQDIAAPVPRRVALLLEGQQTFFHPGRRLPAGLIPDIVQEVAWLAQIGGD